LGPRGSETASREDARRRSVAAPPRTEEEWIESQERVARDDIRRCALALGRDVARAAHLPRGVGEHPLLRLALEQAGDVLASDLVLDRIESFGAHAVAASRGVERTRFTTTALAILQAIGK
jgi:hypothetical protein